MVLRVFDRGLARMMELNFGFQHVRSTSALASPWFVAELRPRHHRDLLRRPAAVHRRSTCDRSRWRTPRTGHAGPFRQDTGHRPSASQEPPRGLSIRPGATPASRPETRCSCSDPTRNSSGSCARSELRGRAHLSRAKTQPLLAGVDPWALCRRISMDRSAGRHS